MPLSLRTHFQPTPRYVAGSSTWNGTQKTDAADGDQITFDGTQVVGNLVPVAPSTNGTITFQVHVNPGIADGTSINNAAITNFNDENDNPQLPVASNTLPTTVNAPIINLAEDRFSPGK